MGKIITFPAPRIEHATCPKCGKSNGPFERLGRGYCNSCLDKECKRQKGQPR